MGVRPVLRPLLALANAAARRAGPPQGTVAERRAAAARGPLQMRVVTARGRTRVVAEDHRVSVEGGQIGVRRYRPAGRSGPLPTHLFLHGGSYWLSDVDDYDPICRSYAGGADCQVVSVDYRLAPEHPFPTGVEDAYAVLLWVAANAGDLDVDLARLSVGGISAGGGLAAALTLMSRDRGGPALCFLAVDIPSFDLTLSQPSIAEFGEGYLLTRASLMEACDFYLPDPELARHPYASPLLAEDLSGLPPAHVLTCECDPLRDEGEAYAARLREAGVAVSTYRAAGHVHGSIYTTRFLPSARAAVAATTTALRTALHG
ncbi:alpha/beta hydrolase [uncultured Friedmanniella sp.]|uniref:alpha/beta hydrolase n=1 Tax=uncultured Friedmanniella sp. TaxID=335381 RepID=UPI0035CA63A6